jgi:hypothetical protein
LLTGEGTAPRWTKAGRSYRWYSNPFSLKK